MTTRNFFRLNRRAFLGAAAVTGGAAASGAAIAAPRPTHVEPDLADATSNAPSYWAHPKRRAKAAEHVEPLERALKD